MKLNTKISIIILEIALIPLLLTGFIANYSIQKQISQTTFSRLNSIAQIQKNRLKDSLQNKQDILSLFTTKIEILSNLYDYNQLPTPKLQKTLNDNLQAAKESAVSIQKIFLADPSGFIVASTDQRLIGTNIGNLDFFNKGIQQNDVSFLKKDSSTGTIYHYLVGPLSLKTKTLGMVTIVTDANDITSLANDYTGLGSSGETLLVKKDLYGNVLFLTPVRFDPQAGLNREVSKDKTNIPSVHAIIGEEGVFSDMVDYRNIPIFAATRYLPTVNWGIVVKIDRSEALAPIQKLQALFIFIVASAGFLIVVIGSSVSHSITRPIRNLNLMAKKITRGNLREQIEITSHDEIADLASSFNHMTKELHDLYSNLDEKVREKTRELEAGVAREEAILASIGDGLAVVDIQGKIIYVNKAFENMLGWKKEDVVGKLMMDIVPREDEHGKEIPFDNHLLSSVLIGKRTNPANVFFFRKDKTKFSVALTDKPVTLNGKIVAIVEAFRDTTHEKELDRAKTEFISLAAHELRTNPGIIDWSCELLLNDKKLKINTEQKDLLSQIYRVNRRTVKLVESLLNTTRFELSTFSVNPEILSVPEVLEILLEDSKEKLESKHLRLIKDIDPNTPTISSDRNLLEVVFDNLIRNAIKYSKEKGTITIGVKPKKETILITVTDTGIGIPENEKGKIFTKLFRAQNAQSVEGTGLGLYLTKVVVEFMNGTITFSSRENRGSTFSVSLPYTGLKKKWGTTKLLKLT